MSPSKTSADAIFEGLSARADLTPEPYRIDGVENVLTPALAIYPALVDANIATTLRLLGGDPNRWRPHVKTAKLGFVMQRLVQRGILNFKCSTTLELTAACATGAADVLLAYPVVGANAHRVRELVRSFHETRISVLVENEDQVKAWRGSGVDLFIDVNPGMNRTGIDQTAGGEILGLARLIRGVGLTFRGLHYYDGHLGKLKPTKREQEAHDGYGRLLEIVSLLEKSGIGIPEVITSGTPAFTSALSFAGFAEVRFLHRVSPGTVVYCDCTSLSQLPLEYGYRPAAVVVSTVVSRPTAHRITCDAGHKAVSADEGVPTCAVLGHPDLRPQKPSEEHLPIDVALNSDPPHIGETLYLVPRHVCPTVNNFDQALIVADGRIIDIAPVTARGHEGPLVKQ